MNNLNSTNINVDNLEGGILIENTDSAPKINPIINSNSSIWNRYI